MNVTHRHGYEHEHEFEPQPGLPERLPASERMLWQGSPQAWSMALHVFHVRKIAIYFAILMAIAAIAEFSSGGGFADALGAISWLALLGGVAVGLLTYLARLSAQSTIYTITDKRVVMRVGIVLTLTFNLPLNRISAAGFRPFTDGSGDIAITLAGNDKIAYVHLWPHAKPWRYSQPEPMLRCVAHADQVAKILVDAWKVRAGSQPISTEKLGSASPSSVVPA